MGPPHLSRAPERDQNWIPEPASSVGSQGRNIPFREDIVESPIRTTISVANDHPLVLPPLKMVNINVLQPPFSRNSP